MVNELQTIEEKISAIKDELDGAYLAPVNQARLSSIRTSIVTSLDSAMIYLNKTYTPMTPWQKEHIVGAINALYWDWLHLALNSLSLAIADPVTISPDNKYKDEIVKLTFDDLTKQMSLIKKLLKLA